MGVRVGVGLAATAVAVVSSAARSNLTTAGVGEAGLETQAVNKRNKVKEIMVVEIFIFILLDAFTQPYTL